MDIKSVKEVVQSLHWGRLKSLLENAQHTKEELAHMLLVVYQCDRMVRRRSNDDGKRRDKFLDLLSEWLEAAGQPELVTGLAQMRDEFKTIDAGYVAIFEMEAQLSTSSLFASQRIAATLVQLQVTAQEVREDIKRSVKASKVFVAELPVFNRQGIRYNPSSVYHTIGAAAFNILMIEAYRGEMFDAQDEIVLPALPTMTEPESESIVANIANAHLWKMWKTVEEKTRFLSGRLKFAVGKPDWLDHVDQAMLKDVEIIIEFDANIDAERFSLLAGERLDERQRQTMFRMQAETNMPDRVASDLAHTVPLPPQGLLSFEEGHAAVGLHHALSVDLATSRVPVLGLTVMELLRGYASLRQLSRTRIEDDANAFPKISRHELETTLTLWGLSLQAAKQFISAATLHRASRDLYDCPLIRCEDDSFILFGWTTADSDLLKVTLSCIGSQDGDFDDKGSLFESRMLKLFQEHGLAARNIKTRRGPCNAEFDYDVVFTWGDYVFFVECKNRSLPGDNPIAVHYFGHTINSHVTQVRRLRNGLDEFPDILADQYPEAVGKKRVFCVVNALPYAQPPQDGIYFSDEGAIRRFFESPSMGLNTFPMDPQSDKPRTRLELATLWIGNSPTPEEFIAYIADLPQLRVAAAHYKSKAQVELLSRRVLVKMVDLHREVPEPRQVAELLKQAKAKKEDAPA